MSVFMKFIAGGAGIAAVATAAPAAAQYYGMPYGYGYNSNLTNVAASRCSSAVQQRLSSRAGLSGILGSVFGAPTYGRVLNVTQVSPRRNTVRVSGLATSGRAYAYSPYGYGAYGAVGYNYRPDLSFTCSVDYRGIVRDVDIYRR